MNKHTLNEFQKMRRIKINKICLKLQLASIPIHNTKTNTLKRLRQLEKSDYEMNGKSPNGIVGALVYLCLPVDTQKYLNVERYTDLLSLPNKLTVQLRIREIRKELRM